MRKSHFGLSASQFPNPMFLVIYLALLAIPAGHLAYAQDSRTVTEPSFPLTCRVLRAHQVSISLDETRFDTARIQAALNRCPAGKAVELVTRGGKRRLLDPTDQHSLRNHSAGRPRSYRFHLSQSG